MKTAVLAILFLLAVSCTQPSLDDSTFSILTYNAYLLFDDTNDGDEYFPFNKDGGYDENKYRKRISLISSALRSMDATLIVLEEIESEKVIIDLINAGLYKSGYKYYGFIDTDIPISVAFISKIPVNDVSVHSLEQMRPVLEVNLDFRSDSITVYALHAPSRLGGPDAEEKRRELFEYISFLLSSSDSLAIAAGDFNEDAGKSSLISIPSSGFDSPLYVTADEGNVSSSVFFCPTVSSFYAGTYCYEDKWYFFDNIIFTSHAFDGSMLEYQGTVIYDNPPYTDSSGRPQKYEIKTDSGYSDHLAVKVIFRYN